MNYEEMSREELLIELKKRHDQEANVPVKETRSKRLEEALRVSQDVFDSLHSMLIAVDPAGCVIRWNVAVEKFTGIPHSRAKKRLVWNMIPFLNSYQKEIATVITTGNNPETRRISVDTGENRKKYLDVSLYPLRYKQKIRGVIFEIEDKTELVKKEQQLLQAQKMETVGNLAGGLAHDFNNVLGGITGGVSILKYAFKKDKTGIFEKFKNDITIIEESASRAADMVKQLLTLSRNNEISIQPVDLNRALKQIKRICRNTLDKSIELIFEYSNNKAMVEADPTQVQQVLLNLCVNAAHAMTIMRDKDEPQGGILHVGLKKIQADPCFRLTHPEALKTNYWVMQVRDTGVGMSPQVMSKIFEPFFTTKDKEQGTGLGMAMVYNIVKQHKGFIDIYSEPGKGSLFNVYLPIPDNAEDSPNTMETDEHIPTGTGLVLVVDDEPSMRETARRILIQCGYEVLPAQNGEEALNIFLTHKNDLKLVLLDMSMPRTTGKETYLQIRALSSKIKVILASGFNKDNRVQELLNLGVNDFIPKPYTMAELADKVHKVLNIH